MENSDIQENIRSEYNFLKEHSANTIERRNNILSLNLTFLAALLAFAITTTPSIALIFPLISFFLALEWVNAYETNILINRYINQCLTKKMPGIGWDEYFRIWRDNEDNESRFPRIRKFSRIGFVFPISQFFALLVGLIIQRISSNGVMIHKVELNYDLLIFGAFDFIFLILTIFEIKKAIWKSPSDLIVYNLRSSNGKKLTKEKLKDETKLCAAQLDTGLNKLIKRGVIAEDDENPPNIIINETPCEKNSKNSAEYVQNPITPQSAAIEIVVHWIEEGLKRDCPELIRKIREEMKK